MRERERERNKQTNKERKKTRKKEEKEFQNGIKEVELHLPVICLCIFVLHTKKMW